MTNFQGGVTRRISREQVLFWSPVILGAVVSLAAGGLLLWPALQRLQRNQQQLEDLKDQQARIPLLRQQIVKQTENLELSQQKQRQILQLIAGSGDISTFMAQLEREARTSGVQLDSYEPITIAAPSPPPPAGSAAAQPDPSQPPPPPPDPLLAPGLIKTSILITGRGNGLQLQDFLRRIERLTLLVVQSDLSLKHEASASARGTNILKLNLTLYAKAPAAAEPKTPPPAPTKS